MFGAATPVLWPPIASGGLVGASGPRAFIPLPLAWSEEGRWVRLGQASGSVGELLQSRLVFPRRRALCPVYAHAFCKVLEQPSADVTNAAQREAYLFVVFRSGKAHRYRAFF